MSSATSIVCEEEYKKYEDTVAVTIAIRKLVDETSTARLWGISRKIQTSDKTEIRPDMSFESNNPERSAVFFEFKWSLTSSSVRSELDGIKRYRLAHVIWEDGEAAYNDVVLVVHSELAPIVKKALADMTSSGDSTLSSGFAVWSWSYSVPRKSEEGTEPVLVIQPFEGALQNQSIASMIGHGYKIPPEVMRSDRQKFFFIPDKPPVQYTMAFVLVHPLSFFQDPTKKRSVVNLNESTVFDVAYELANKLYMGRSPEDGNDASFPGNWMKEAFSKLSLIGLDTVTLPFKPRKTILKYICDRLRNPPKKPSPKGTKPRTKPNGERLDKWFS